MIFNVPFVVIAIFADIVKLVVSLAIGASLVFYAKYSKDEYASSIRWSRTGGLREMIELLWRSSRHIPTRSSMVLLFALLASFSTIAVSIILTAMVSRVDKRGDSVVARSLTTQLNSMDPSFWTVYMRPESTADEALERMLADPYRNPNPAPKTQYTPRSFPYTTRCSESRALLVKGNSRILLPSNNKACLRHNVVPVLITYDWDPRFSLTFDLDPTTLMVVAPVVKVDVYSYVIEVMEPLLMVTDGDRGCARDVVTDVSRQLLMAPPLDGVIALPKTYVSKCQYGADGSMVIAATHVQFAVNRLNDFDSVTKSILHSPDSLPLLKAMSDAIKKGILSNQLINPRLVMLVREAYTESGFHFLMCLLRDRLSSGGQVLLCSYMLTSATIVSPQPIDPTIQADLNHGLTRGDMYGITNQLDFTILHLPQTPQAYYSNKEPIPLFSAGQLVSSTSQAPYYLASLGHNVQTYNDPITNATRVYVLYDTVKTEDVYEVSTTGFMVVCTLTIVLAIFWVISEKFSTTVYNSTIYKTIYKELRTKDESTQMLMHCAFDTLKIDGNHIVPGTADELSAGAGLFSQDHPMVVLKSPVDAPNHRHESQPPEQLDGTSAQSPLSAQWSNNAPTPTVSPTTANATDSSSTLATNSTPLQEIQSQPLGSDHQGAPPQIPPRPLSHNTLSVISDRARPLGTTRRSEDQAVIPSNAQRITFIQSPFE